MSDKKSATFGNLLFLAYSNEHRVQLNVVEIMLDNKNEDSVVQIGVFCVHFHRMWETIRMKQLAMVKKLKETFCDKMDKNMAIVIIGDFNSLRYLDYSKEKWESIYDIRKKKAN